MIPGGTGEGDKVHEDDLPFDDPVARTRMAWLRTTLIVALIGLLMWRSGYIAGHEWWSIAWVVPSLLILCVALVRMRSLTRNRAGESRLAPLALMTVGFVTLAAVGVGLVVV